MTSENFEMCRKSVNVYSRGLTLAFEINEGRSKNNYIQKIE